MKQLAIITVTFAAGLLAWLFAGRLSADALGMAVGLVFGVFAGLPTALLVLAANRRPPIDEYCRDERRYNNRQLAAPPVIVIASPQSPQQYPGAPRSDSAGYPERQALPDLSALAPRERVFRVVGEQDTWLDEW